MLSSVEVLHLLNLIEKEFVMIESQLISDSVKEFNQNAEKISRFLESLKDILREVDFSDTELYDEIRKRTSMIFRFRSNDYLDLLNKMIFIYLAHRSYAYDDRIELILYEHTSIKTQIFQIKGNFSDEIDLTKMNGVIVDILEQGINFGVHELTKEELIIIKLVDHNGLFSNFIDNHFYNTVSKTGYNVFNYYLKIRDFYTYAANMSHSLNEKDTLYERFIKNKFI